MSTKKSKTPEVGAPTVYKYASGKRYEGKRVNMTPEGRPSKR